jgi:hypothetical protein
MMGINTVKVKISAFWNVMWCNVNRTVWEHQVSLSFDRDVCKESDEIIFARGRK